MFSNKNEKVETHKEKVEEKESNINITDVEIENKDTINSKSNPESKAESEEEIIESDVIESDPVGGEIVCNNVVQEKVMITEEVLEPISNYAGIYSITAYTWTGNVMANGEYPYVGCAASCDFPLGTVINIEGVGTYVVNDVCPTSGVVDLYMDSYEECITFGRLYANVYIQ